MFYLLFFWVNHHHTFVCGNYFVCMLPISAHITLKKTSALIYVSRWNRVNTFSCFIKDIFAVNLVFNFTYIFIYLFLLGVNGSEEYSDHKFSLVPLFWSLLRLRVLIAFDPKCNNQYSEKGKKKKMFFLLFWNTFALRDSLKGFKRTQGGLWATFWKELKSC